MCESILRTAHIQADLSQQGDEFCVVAHNVPFSGSMAIPFLDVKRRIALIEVFPPAIPEKDFSVECVNRVTPEIIDELLPLLHADPASVATRSLVEQLSGALPLTALYWGMGKDYGEAQNTALFISHSATLSHPLSYGDLTTVIHVVRRGKSSLGIEFSQSQNGTGSNRRIGYGASGLVFDSYPYSGAKTETGIQANCEGFSKCGQPVCFTQEQVSQFAKVSSDYNAAHVNDAYLTETRFAAAGTIVHGIFAGMTAIVSAAEAFRFFRPEPFRYQLTFVSPVWTNVSYVQTYARMQENGDLDLLVVDQHGETKITGSLSYCG